MSGEFYALGCGEPYNVSAISGSGTGELLDDVVKVLDAEAVVEELDFPTFGLPIIETNPDLKFLFIICNL